MQPSIQSSFKHFDFDLQDTKSQSNICAIHKDSYVSYCLDCQHQMCVQCIITHQKLNESHQILSFNDLKNFLSNKYTNIIEGLNQSLNKLTEYQVNENISNEQEIKYKRGIDILNFVQTSLIQQIQNYFQLMEKNWTEIFNLSLQFQIKKQEFLKELNELFQFSNKKQTELNQLLSKPGIQFSDLQNIIKFQSQIKAGDQFLKAVNKFINQNEHQQKNQIIPELNSNKQIYNQIITNIKDLIDYNIDFKESQLNTSKLINIKTQELSKQKTQEISKSLSSSKQNIAESQFKLVPVLARNRRLMVFDLYTNQFKEFMLSDIHSIPQCNQIVFYGYPPKFIIIGGHYSKKPTSKVFYYDSNNSEFKVLQQMSQPRCFHKVIQFRDKIIVSGGCDKENYQSVKSVEMYDLETQKWTDLPPMKNSRHSHSMCLFENNEKSAQNKNSLNSKIIVVGGVGTDNRYVQEIEIFDMNNSKWEIFTCNQYFSISLIHPFCCQINKQEVIIFGGYRYFGTEYQNVKNDVQEKEYIRYPFSNTQIYIMNLPFQNISLNKSYSLELGLVNTGSQPINYQQKIYWVGGINNNSLVQEQLAIDFCLENNLHRSVFSVSQEGIGFVDYVIFK